MAVSFIARYFSPVVIEDFDDSPVLPMMFLVIWVGLIRKVYSDPVTWVKMRHS